LQHPGPNIYNASNVAVAASNGQLVLRVSKSGRGRSSSSSCAEVSLDQSLGLGTYVVEIDTNPSLVSAARGYCQASLLQLLPLLLLLCTLLLCTRQSIRMRLCGICQLSGSLLLSLLHHHV
jgi:hypothetical protein